MNGWHDGFAHPLHGWDHLVVMIAIGLWATQQRGRAIWLIPLTFIGVMTVGGIVGATGIVLPGVEKAILLSVVVCTVLVARRIRLRPSVSVLVVGLFGFAHGFAHGAEMPHSASFAMFGLGFILATLLLHGCGIAVGRAVAVVLAGFVAVSGVAQDAVSLPAVTPTPKPGGQQSVAVEEPVVVVGRSDSLVGAAESASQGTVGATQLEERPLLRASEVLETVPGMIVTQHSGDGKANQYFLRGFNLDHGTDFATSVNGVPVNLPTHAHGQGYTDLNFMIPELVETVNYKKGVYYADQGDFSSAGAADLEYFHVLPTGIALAQVGMYDYYRTLLAGSPRVGPGNLLYAGELVYNDGPWDNPAHFRKGNGVLRYSVGGDQDGWSVTAMAYKAKWDSTDQIAQHAVREGIIDRFGTLDDSDGGNSQRYSLSAEWHRTGENGLTRLVAYGYYYDLDLFSNFTYFLDDPVNGDQFEQKDSRWVGGLLASHSWQMTLGPVKMDNTVGAQFRIDTIHNGLFHTVQRERLSTIRSDDIVETTGAVYTETREQWAPWFRSIAGLRFDIVNFDVSSNTHQNSGNVTDTIPNPKLALIFGPWANTEFYLDGGLGYHSNDGRGVTTNVEPGSNPPVKVQPADPLVRTYGAEVGARSTWIPNLQSTLALWWLKIDSELLFVGDAGTTEASRPSERYGLEFANFYTPTKWLTLDADFAFTHARFTNNDPAGDYIPGSPNAVISAGITVHDLHGFFGSLRLRYFGPRPLIEDGSVQSDSTLLLNAQVGYQINKTWTVTVDFFNLLNSKDSDISYYYASRLAGEPPGPDDGGYNDIHFHPVEPFQVRAAVTARF